MMNKRQKANWVNLIVAYRIVADRKSTTSDVMLLLARVLDRDLLQPRHKAGGTVIRISSEAESC
jgi:hypothetical protein